MSVAFQDPAVALDGGHLSVQATYLNQSSEPWLSSGGWAAGYHLFDTFTGTLVIDGERRPLDLSPGESRAFEMRIPTPAEPGEYAVYISVLQEHVAWLYERGWPFLLIDVSVSDEGVATLGRWRVADMRSVRTRLLARSFGRAFYLPFQSIWKQRNLIRTLVRRDILSRYAASFGGAFWAVLNPLL
ncbi:MAG: hypothetical protein ABJC09_15550, partial [Terriglobia bacterium]